MQNKVSYQAKIMLKLAVLFTIIRSKTTSINAERLNIAFDMVSYYAWAFSKKLMSIV